MGVNTFLLDRRTATLVIGGSRQPIGTLRRFFKVTELDEGRAAELDAAARITPSPVAALVMDITELPLAGDPDRPVPAHLVLGWDEGRGSVTDFGWDYLPRLGYALREPETGAYVLYEERNGLLHPVNNHRAQELNLLNAGGELVGQGQPRITECRSVKRYIPGYAEADCTLAPDVHEKLLVAIPNSRLPPERWFIGKRPMDVARYQSDNLGHSR